MLLSADVLLESCSAQATSCLSDPCGNGNSSLCLKSRIMSSMKSVARKVNMIVERRFPTNIVLGVLALRWKLSQRHLYRGEIMVCIQSSQKGRKKGRDNFANAIPTRSGNWSVGEFSKGWRQQALE